VPRVSGPYWTIFSRRVRAPPRHAITVAPLTTTVMTAIADERHAVHPASITRWPHCRMVRETVQVSFIISATVAAVAQSLGGGCGKPP
jgi:hypothetical protein